ncbi:unnamed protein product [Jaminaea pallidilutea]
MSDSESSSSAGSSSSGSQRSASPAGYQSQPAPSSTSKLANSKSSNNTASSIYYEGPDHYQRSQFDLSDASVARNFVLKQANKQLWTFKLPEGMDASQLDGVKFKLPPRSSQASSSSSSSVSMGEPLVSLSLVTASSRHSQPRKQDRYQLHSVPLSSSRRLHPEAHNAQAGLTAREAKKQGEKSQLIDEEAEPEQSAQMEDQVLGASLSEMYVYVPAEGAVGGSKKDNIVRAPLPITQHFEFVFAGPQVQQAIPSESEEKAKAKARAEADEVKSKGLTPAEVRLRALEKARPLKGHFAPTGSLYEVERNGGSEESFSKQKAPQKTVSPDEKKKSSSSSSSSSKEDKKRKKADADADVVKAADDAGEGAGSGSKEKKAKKVKLEGSPKEKKVKA